MARSSRALRFKLMFAFLILLVVGWSVMWFVAATIVDRRVETSLMAANRAGVVAECTDRSVTGFPFRIEVRCGSGTHAVTGNGEGKIGGLVVAALVYDPNEVIAEIRSPAEVNAAGMPSITAAWDLARASAQLDFSAGALDLFHAEIRGADIRVGDLPMTMREVDADLRRDPMDPGALGFALSVAEAALDGIADAVNLEVRGTMQAGAPLLTGRPEALLAALAEGRAPVTLERLMVENGPLQVAANGNLVLNASGLLSGMLTVAIAGDEEATSLGMLTSDTAEGVATFVTNLLKSTPQTTTIDGRPAKELTFRFDEGRIRVGALPFALPFTVPPIRIAAR